MLGSATCDAAKESETRKGAGALQKPRLRDGSPARLMSLQLVAEAAARNVVGLLSLSAAPADDRVWISGWGFVCLVLLLALSLPNELAIDQLLLSLETSTGCCHNM